MNSTTIILLAAGVVSTLLITATLVLFFHRRNKPIRYQERPFGRLTAALLRLSGHHPCEFEELDPSVAWRFAAVGLSVLVPPLIAFTGIWASCEVFEVGGGLGKAFAGGLFILLLDFILVAALSGGGSAKGTWLLVVYRSAVAIGLGWFIGRAPILLIYQSSIDGLNRENQWSEIRTTMEEREQIRKDSMAAHLPLAEHYASRRKLLEEELKAVIGSKDPVMKEIIRKERQVEDEHLRGREGRVPGKGSYYEETKKYLEQEKSRLERIEKEEKRIQDALATLAADQDEQLRKLNDDPAFKKLGEAASNQIGAAQDARPGWSEREDLLLEWVKADPAKRMPGLVAIHALLLLLDVLPLLTMLFVPKAEVEAARRAKLAEARAEADCAEKLAGERAECVVRERNTNALLQKRIPVFKETADLRLDYAEHQILRRLQKEAAMRPVFFRLRFGTKSPTPEQEAEWEAAAEPLRHAVEQNLRDFDTLIR
jgi:hypothetical protein